MQERTNKVLLMGKAQAGKTSMRSIIFANSLAKDTSRLGPTIKIAQSTLRFLGDLQLDLWDCGGQDKFLQSYFESQREKVFRGVAVLIYVFDVISLQKQSKEPSLTGLTNDIIEFQKALGALKQYSPKSQIFCLIHKMDTIAPKMKDKIFNEYRANLEFEAKTVNLNMRCFPTSIWDESLFGAWSHIVCSLLTDSKKITDHLTLLNTLCMSDEIVLFESSTFLYVANATNNQNLKCKDNNRFEKIANIVKQFKLRCSQCNFGRYLFQSMTISNKNFSSYIGPFTKTTHILVIFSNPNINLEAIMMNLQASKPLFSKLLALHVGINQN